MRSRRKVYRNGLQEGDLKASLCGFGGVKCKWVCFFAWNLELILSSYEGRSSDSVLPCLLLLHCQVKWCKSTQIALKLRNAFEARYSVQTSSHCCSGCIQMVGVLLKELEFDQIKETYWTDSKAVLGYINSARRFHVFVGNRVQEIRERTSPAQWHYIGTKENPADIASPRSGAQELTDTRLWWNGPDFLWNPQDFGTWLTLALSFNPTKSSRRRPMSSRPDVVPTLKGLPF